MAERLTNIPTNLIMGFLGVGKTTAILDLLKQKPKDENWAVLVNEFGKVGIDGAIFSAAGATVKEISGGCLCCAVGLPFQTSLNRLIKEVRPDRLLIEPTGLGHPKKVMDMLIGGSFKEVLDVRANICLVDPRKLKDKRYITNECFIDQIALSDVLVANKMDLVSDPELKFFHHWINKSWPSKALIAQTIQGQLDINWLDINRNPQRRVSYPDAHQITNVSRTDETHEKHHNEADGYQSFGCIFPGSCRFDYILLNRLFRQLNWVRIKGIIDTDKGWFIVNGTDGIVNYDPTFPLANSRIEIIALQNQIQDISTALDECRIE